VGRRYFINCVHAKVFPLDFNGGGLYRLTKRIKRAVKFAAPLNRGEKFHSSSCAEHPGLGQAEKPNREMKRGVTRKRDAPFFLRDADFHTTRHRKRC
jgi:hypothetical protein